MRSTLTIKPAITDFDIWRKWFEFYFNVISFENYAKTDFIAYNFNSKNKRQTFKIPTLIRCIRATLAKEWNSMDYFVWWFYVYLYSSICDCIMASIWLSPIWCTFNGTSMDVEFLCVGKFNRMPWKSYFVCALDDVYSFLSLNSFRPEPPTNLPLISFLNSFREKKSHSLNLLSFLCHLVQLRRVHNYIRWLHTFFVYIYFASLETYSRKINNKKLFAENK